MEGMLPSSSLEEVKLITCKVAFSRVRGGLLLSGHVQYHRQAIKKKTRKKKGVIRKGVLKQNLNLPNHRLTHSGILSSKVSGWRAVPLEKSRCPTCQLIRYLAGLYPACPPKAHLLCTIHSKKLRNRKCIAFGHGDSDRHYVHISSHTR